MKNCDKVHIERMAEAISDNRTRDLFKELSKIKGRNNLAPSNVDGFNNEHDIEQVFSTKYKNLNNNVPYNSKRMNDIKMKLMTRCLNNVIYHIE